MSSLTLHDDTNEVIKINMENFIPFIEGKFNEKYESSLESLKQRFAGVYTLIKIIYEKTIEIHDILAEDNSDSNIFSTYKPLFDNMIRLLDFMVREFPECLDLEFVDSFFSSIQDRLKILAAHFHQISHINLSDPNIINKMSKKNYKNK